MNLIVLSHMYPDEARPYSGIFVQEQVKALSKLLKGAIYVISPTPYAPRIMWFRKKWRKYGTADRVTSEGGIKVIRPRYLCLPGSRYDVLNSYSMYLSVRGTLGDILKKTGTDNTLIHSHTILPDGLAGARAARRFGLKSICTLHGSDINIYPHTSKSIYRFTKLGLEMNHSLIAVSRAIKERALKIHADAKIDVITNGVNLDKFEAGKDERVNERNIVFVGRLAESKGVKELLQAFKQIRQEYQDTRLVLIGEPILKDWILEYAEKEGLTDAIDIIGGVGHEALREFFQKGYIFVLPSYSEGMPVVMFEAMAMRLPVVVSAVGGVPEVIRDGENGLLIKPRSVDEIVKQVSRLLKDRALAENIAETAYKEAVSLYTWDASARMLIEKYEQLLGR